MPESNTVLLAGLIRSYLANRLPSTNELRLIPFDSEVDHRQSDGLPRIGELTNAIALGVEDGRGRLFRVVVEDPEES